MGRPTFATNFAFGNTRDVTSLKKASGQSNEDEEAHEVVDTSHPTYSLTLENKNSLFISRLPIEIQQKILVLSMEDVMEIRPYQVEERSNKFLWNEDIKTFTYESLKFTEERKCTKELPMFIKLGFTCKHFYRTIYDRCFYGLHTFSFTDQNELFAFLAAVTPERRQQIKNIAVDVKPPRSFMYKEPALKHYVLNPVERDLRLHGGIITLLCQCPLETLTLRFYSGWRKELHFRDPLTSFHDSLYRIHDFYSSADEHPILGLPCTRFALSYDGERFIPLWNAPWSYEMRSSIEEFTSTCPDLPASRLKPKVIALIENIRKIHATHQHRLEEKAMNRLGIHSTITWRDLNKALHSSGLDFPGEVRIGQTRRSDKYVYFEGPISQRTRTREKPEAEKISHWGVEEMPKYEEQNEGPLKHFLVKVDDLKWDEDGRPGRLALHANWVQRYVHDPDRGEFAGYADTWEGVDIIDKHSRLTPLFRYFRAKYNITFRDDEEWIFRFYKRTTIHHVTLDLLRKKHKQLTEDPGPTDVQALVEPSMVAESGTDKRSLRKNSTMGKQFRTLESTRKWAILRLEKYIGRHEAWNAKEERKLARAAAAAARKALKAEKRAQRSAASSSAAAASPGGGKAQEEPQKL